MKRLKEFFKDNQSTGMEFESQMSELMKNLGEAKDNVKFL